MLFIIQLLDDEIELGMGIHGESGAQRLKFTSCQKSIDLALSHLFLGVRALHITPNDDVLLFVNNLGLMINYRFISNHVICF